MVYAHYPVTRSFYAVATFAAYTVAGLLRFAVLVRLQFTHWFARTPLRATHTFWLRTPRLCRYGCGYTHAVLTCLLHTVHIHTPWITCGLRTLPAATRSIHTTRITHHHICGLRWICRFYRNYRLRFALRTYHCRSDYAAHRYRCCILRLCVLPRVHRRTVAHTAAFLHVTATRFCVTILRLHLRTVAFVAWFAHAFIYLAVTFCRLPAVVRGSRSLVYTCTTYRSRTCVVHCGYRHVCWFTAHLQLPAVGCPAAVPRTHICMTRTHTVLPHYRLRVLRTLRRCGLGSATYRRLLRSGYRRTLPFPRTALPAPAVTLPHHLWFPGCPVVPRGWFSSVTTLVTTLPHRGSYGCLPRLRCGYRLFWLRYHHTTLPALHRALVAGYCRSLVAFTRYTPAVATPRLYVARFTFCVLPHILHTTLFVYRVPLPVRSAVLRTAVTRLVVRSVTVYVPHGYPHACRFVTLVTHSGSRLVHVLPVVPFSLFTYARGSRLRLRSGCGYWFVTVHALPRVLPTRCCYAHTGCYLHLLFACRTPAVGYTHARTARFTVALTHHYAHCLDYPLLRFGSRILSHYIHLLRSTTHFTTRMPLRTQVTTRCGCHVAFTRFCGLRIRLVTVRTFAFWLRGCTTRRAHTRVRCTLLHAPLVLGYALRLRIHVHTRSRGYVTATAFFTLPLPAGSGYRFYGCVTPPLLHYRGSTPGLGSAVGHTTVLHHGLVTILRFACRAPARLRACRLRLPCGSATCHHTGSCHRLPVLPLCTRLHGCRTLRLLRVYATHGYLRGAAGSVTIYWLPRGYIPRLLHVWFCCGSTIPLRGSYVPACYAVTVLVCSLRVRLAHHLPFSVHIRLPHMPYLLPYALPAGLLRRCLVYVATHAFTYHTLRTVYTATTVCSFIPQFWFTTFTALPMVVHTAFGLVVAAFAVYATVPACPRGCVVYRAPFGLLHVVFACHTRRSTYCGLLHGCCVYFTVTRILRLPRGCAFWFALPAGYIPCPFGFYIPHFPHLRFYAARFGSRLFGWLPRLVRTYPLPLPAFAVTVTHGSVCVYARGLPAVGFGYRSHRVLVCLPALRFTFTRSTTPRVLRLRLVYSSHTTPHTRFPGSHVRGCLLFTALFAGSFTVRVATCYGYLRLPVTTYLLPTGSPRSSHLPYSSGSTISRSWFCLQCILLVVYG